MRYILLYLVGLLALTSCNKKNSSPKANVVKEESIEVKTYNFKSFEAEYLKTDTEKIKVINFWATWCKPCVDELPYFEELASKDKGVEVILVSLDLASEKESRLIPFLKKHQVTSKVVLLDEPDGDSWIPLVDEDWSGSIPTTLVMSKNKKQVYEHSLNYKELVEAVNIFKNEK